LEQCRACSGVGTSKKDQGLCDKQRTGAFLLTLDENAVRLNAGKAIRLNPKSQLDRNKKTPEPVSEGFYTI
jgi:hypothetical protein